MVETRSGRRFAIFFVVGAFLVLLLGRWIQPVDNVAATAVAPFAAVASGAASAVGDTVSGIFDAGQLQEQNTGLRRQNARLLQEVIRGKEAVHENAIFRTIIKFVDRNSHMDLLPGRVIWSDPTGLAAYIMINKGSQDGLRQGMTVLDQNGYYVGTISNLTPNAATVLLMGSPSSSVGAYDMTTQATGVVEGRFADTPQLRYVVTSSRLRPNDLVLTSGQLNLHPRGILLGQVVTVAHHADEPFQTANIRPAADFQHLEIIQVVRNWVPNIPAQLISNH